ncbi:MAG: HAD family hydrolase [Lachnospiraceae bacterium]
MKQDIIIKGILFDMDGLVLDTEKLYTRFWQEAAQAFGYPMTRVQALGMRSLNRGAGLAKLQSYFGDTVDYEAIRAKRIALMNAFIEKEGVEVKPGIRELLAYLKEKGIKTAIATSSPLERTTEYLTSVGLEREFDRLVSGYMVERGKPEPDIYLYAAKELGLALSECMVLEDSPAGLLAAKRAGCLPVMIPDQDEPDEETKKLLYAQVGCLSDVIGLLEGIRTWS